MNSSTSTAIVRPAPLSIGDLTAELLDLRPLPAFAVVEPEESTPAERSDGADLPPAAAPVHAMRADEYPPPVLELIVPFRRTILRGRLLDESLTPRQFNILWTMLRVGCLWGVRLTGRQLAERSGHNDPVRELRRLRRAHPAWETVLVFPGTRGRGGYGLYSASCRELPRCPGGFA